MKKILTVLSVLALSALVTIGQSQQSGGYPDSWSGGFAGGFFKKDTTFIINWNFDTGMPEVTEVGGVDIIVHPTNSVVTDSVLRLIVSGGGSDYVQVAIPDFNEAWLRINFRISDADTSRWGADQTTTVATIKNASTANGEGRIRVILSTGDLRWRIDYKDDAGASSNTVGSTVVVTDTWYSLLWHIKKSTASGADDGISNLKVDGVEIIAVTDWDNPITAYNSLRLGYDSHDIDCILYIDDVVFFSEEGLP